MKKKLLIAAAITSMFSGVSFADTNELVNKLRKVNNGKFANSKIEVLREAPMEELKGFYEASIDGQSLVVYKDGVLGIVNGEIYDLDRLVSLTAIKRMEKMNEITQSEIPKIEDSVFVEFKSKAEKELGTLYVFTDPSCGYCKKLHSEVEDLNNGGVTVKYIPYPRSALVDGQAGYEQIKQIMCAEDQNLAMTEVKAGTDQGKYIRDNYDQKCLDLIAKGKEVGQKIGITGTPFLYMSNGNVIPGYKPSRDIINQF